MELTRHHGLGNVFLIALLEELPKNPGELAQKYCDPEKGIGADGLIIGTPPSENSNAVNRFNLFNKDGGRAELSGNGLRCFAQALSMTSRLEDETFHVETDVGLRKIKIEKVRNEKEISATAEIGEARVTRDLPDIDLSKVLKEKKSLVIPGCVDIGNPHLVVVMDELLDAIELEQFAFLLDEKFAELNVHLMKVKDGVNIRMQTWERGVGLTEACGTGACASAAVALAWGMLEKEASQYTFNVNVHMPGGSVFVNMLTSSPFSFSHPWVELSGPSVFMDRHQVDDG